MQKKALAAALPLSAYQHLRDPNHRARFAELLSPEQTASRLAESYPKTGHQGWALRVELTAEEIEVLEVQGHERYLLLDVVQFSPGLPVALLRTMAEGVEFRFGVPLWQPGASEWLLDAVDHERLLVLLDPVDDDYGIAMHGVGNLLVDRVSLISAAALARQADGEESTHQMLVAGLRLLQDNIVQPGPRTPVPLAVRVAVAGRGESALEVMSGLMAAEATMPRTS